MSADVNFDRYGISMGRPKAIVHLLANGYILTLIPAQDGMVTEQCYCADEQAVGQALLNYVAEENCK